MGGFLLWVKPKGRKGQWLLQSDRWIIANCLQWYYFSAPLQSAQTDQTNGFNSENNWQLTINSFCWPSVRIYGSTVKSRVAIQSTQCNNLWIGLTFMCGVGDFFLLLVYHIGKRSCWIESISLRGCIYLSWSGAYLADMRLEEGKRSFSWAHLYWPM